MGMKRISIKAIKNHKKIGESNGGDYRGWYLTDWVQPCWSSDITTHLHNNKDNKERLKLISHILSLDYFFAKKIPRPISDLHSIEDLVVFPFLPIPLPTTRQGRLLDSPLLSNFLTLDFFFLELENSPSPSAISARPRGRSRIHGVGSTLRSKLFTDLKL